jgi:hypothetical protein
MVDANLLTGVEGIFACGNVLHVHDALMEVTVDGTVVRRRRFPHVQPSEMIRLVLRPEEAPSPDPARPNLMEVSIR